MVGGRTMNKEFTIDVAHYLLFYRQKKYIIAHNSGHVEYTRNMGHWGFLHRKQAIYFNWMHAKES